MTGLFLQLAGADMAWEEVDQFTWDNWERALTHSGSQRYTGNRVQREPTTVSIQVDKISSRDLAVICRFCSVRETECPGSVNGGFVHHPEFVPFTIRKKTILHQMNGGNFVASKAAAEAHVAGERSVDK